MARKLYPIGLQTFERIRVEDKFYIDKTEYVYRMAHTDGTYFFLSRPRRFGKSLLLTTMKSYFEGKKELFKGLAIEKLEKDWISYPVLHFDMSMGKHMEIAQLERYFDQQLAEQEQKWGITNPAVDANVRLISLIQTAYRETGKQVVILIDEYDAPLLDVVHEDEKTGRTSQRHAQFLQSAKRMREIAPLRIPHRHNQILSAQHLQRIEQHHQYQYGRAVCRHLRNYGR